MTAFSLLIKGGQTVDPTGRRRADVGIVDGTIAAVETKLDPGDAEVVLDASDAVVATGFVDLCARVGEPGNEAAETVESAAIGAAVGGFTTIHASPDTQPFLDDPSVVRDLQRLAADAAIAVKATGAITKGGAGADLAPMREMAALGVSLFSDGGHYIADGGVMRRAFEYLRTTEATLMLHPEAADVCGSGVMHEGDCSSRMGVAGRSAVAEEIAVGRDLALAGLTGAAVHFQRVSTSGALRLISAAKASGMAVSCDVTSHHLDLTDAVCCGYDPNTRLSPPLRTIDHVRAIGAGVTDGTIDAIVSDHCPCVPELKEMPFDMAPPGSLSFETAFAAAWTALEIGIEDLLTLLSWQPAKIARLGAAHDGKIVKGRAADLVVLDLGETWQVSGQQMMSPSHNTILEGRTLTGRVRHTVSNGKAVVVDNLACS